MDKRKIMVIMLSSVTSVTLASCPSESPKSFETSDDIACKISSQTPSSKLKKFLALALLLSQASDTRKSAPSSISRLLKIKK
jgi:hypothetical protein